LKLRTLSTEDLEDRLGVARLAQFGSDGRIVQELRNRRQCSQMRLELILRDKKEDDKVNWLSI
jgi:hypothetical protein